MKKPYIKKYCNVSMFTVWIVDGNYVRKNIDEEFTNFGQHHRFNFIPKHEFWIDKEYGRDNEAEYYIDHLIVENRLMADGKSYNEAIDKADLVERRERSKLETIQEEAKINLDKEDVVKKVHKKLLKKYSKNLRVWIVNGRAVRDLFCIDFTEGGHDKVYSFIPDGEIWIDDDLSAKERKFILLHEMHERNLMAHGWGYRNRNKNGSKCRSAHRSASEIELFCRRHPKELEKRLKDELNKCIAVKNWRQK